MSTTENSKNTVTETDIKAGGNVTIGDQKNTTINVYGMNADSKDLEFFIRVYKILILLFALAFFVFLIFPSPKDEMFDYVQSFASGGFSALGFLILALFYRSKNKSAKLNNIVNEVQGNN